MQSRRILAGIEREYARYRSLGEGAMAQLGDEQLCDGSEAASSIATIVWHVSGNLASRFTDFLTSDGEKPWRKRDEEFVARRVERAEVLETWGRGWDVLEAALAELRDVDLDRTVTIRGAPHTVHEALARSLAHTAYHVGQIVYVAKALRGSAWSSLSIPPGESETFNRRMGMGAEADAPTEEGARSARDD